MSTLAERPDHLPDFRKPPLIEVVLGVQFNRVPGYQHIYAAEIWDLFRTEYPEVQEKPPIQPQFETFGLQFPAMQPPFMFMSGPIRNRYWFVKTNETELIQFQEDRLLHNWKKIAAASNEYPHYETMVSRFSKEFGLVQEYFKDKWKQELVINQCEISYINHITADSEDFPLGSDWLNFVSFSRNPEDFSVAFREVVHDKDGVPRARLTCEAGSAIQNNRKILHYTLTVRGAPQTPSIDAALELMSIGRDVIVTRFAETTTVAAHKAWERTK